MSRDKQNIKTTDWLTRGMTEAEIAKEKEEAIKEAEAELRDKQIEEMRKDVASIHRFFFEDDDYEVLDDYIADMLFARGYRKVDDIFEDIFEGRLEVVNKRSGDKLKKASDVAEEIFAEIERMCVDTFGNFNHRVFFELKEKYTQNSNEKKG